MGNSRPSHEGTTGAAVPWQSDDHAEAQKHGYNEGLSPLVQRPLHRLEMANVAHGRAFSPAALAEIDLVDLDFEPEKPAILAAYCDHYTDDGRTSVQLVGSQALGVARPHLSGRYVVVPGVQNDTRYRTDCLFINQHRQPLYVETTVFAPTGEHCSSAPRTLPPFSATRIALEDAIPGLSSFLAAGRGIGSLRVGSEFKMTTILLLVERESDIITGFDHTVGYVTHKPFMQGPVPPPPPIWRRGIRKIARGAKRVIK